MNEVACPHSLVFGAIASSCSQCLGAVPRKIVMIDGVVWIDGRQRAPEPAPWVGSLPAKRRGRPRRAPEARA